MEEAKSWESLTKDMQSLVKGQDPKDLKYQCLRLCQKYLSGNWNKLSVDQMEIKRLVGGMMNSTNLCKIPVHLQDSSPEPKEVVVRMYGPIADFHNLELMRTTLEDNIKFILLSANSVGPHVYGVNEKAVILKYYQHRLFIEKDFYNKELRGQVATKLARMHSMKPPLDKSRADIRDMIVCSIKQLIQNYDLKRKLFEEYNCKTLLETDLKAETDWLLDKIKSFDSMVVFSHNDFRLENVLVTEEEGAVICDYDFSGYFSRGLDFASFFHSWMKFDENSFELKEESVVRDFIGKYLNESAAIYGKQYLDNKSNTIDHILLEMKVFRMVYSVALSGISIINLVNLPFDDKTLLTMANNEAENFLALKKLLGDF